MEDNRVPRFDAENGDMPNIVWNCEICNKPNDNHDQKCIYTEFKELLYERDALKSENEKLLAEKVQLKKDLEEAVRIAKRDHPQNCGQCFDSGILRTGSPCSDGIFLSRFPVENKKEDGNG